MIYKGISKSNLISSIENSGRIWYERNKDFNPKRIDINTIYWGEAKYKNISEDSFGVSEELGLKIINRGFGEELNRNAGEFAAAVNMVYKGNTRIKVRVFDIRLLRNILNRETRNLESELEVRFYKTRSWREEFDDCKNFIKERLRQLTTHHPLRESMQIETNYGTIIGNNL